MARLGILEIILKSYLLKGKKIGSIPAISFSLHDMVMEEEKGSYNEGRTENGADIREADGTI